MKILLQTAARRAATRGAPRSRRALPEAAIAVWPDAPAEPDYALVWKPPAELFARVRPAKAIFNLGAGVDALLAVPTLPDGRAGDPPRGRGNGGADGRVRRRSPCCAPTARRTPTRRSSAKAAGSRGRASRKPAFGVGILGFGVLGQAVASALAPFGFPLARLEPHAARRSPGVESFAGRAELRAFLARVAGARLPAAVDARDARACSTAPRSSQLPRGAHVVNVARGDIVVDEDLVALLDGGHLAGATLDVFRDEPLPAGASVLASSADHADAARVGGDAGRRIPSRRSPAKIRRLERGEPVTGIVDRARGY